MDKLILPVLTGGRIEHREYSVSGVELSGKHSLQSRVMELYSTRVLVNDSVGVYVFTLGVSVPLPYAYFRFQELEYYTTDEGFSTGLRRMQELLDLAQAAGRVQALTVPQCFVE